MTILAGAPRSKIGRRKCKLSNKYVASTSRLLGRGSFGLEDGSSLFRYSNSISRVLSSRSSAFPSPSTSSPSSQPASGSRSSRGRIRLRDRPPGCRRRFRRPARQSSASPDRRDRGEPGPRGRPRRSASGRLAGSWAAASRRGLHQLWQARQIVGGFRQGEGLVIQPKASSIRFRVRWLRARCGVAFIERSSLAKSPAS
jgi:hypothetical protein